MFHVLRVLTMSMPATELPRFLWLTSYELAMITLYTGLFVCGVFRRRYAHLSYLSIVLWRWPLFLNHHAPLKTYYLTLKPYLMELPLLDQFWQFTYSKKKKKRNFLVRKLCYLSSMRNHMADWSLRGSFILLPKPFIFWSLRPTILVVLFFF